MNINPFAKKRPQLSWQKLKSKQKNVPDLYRSTVPGGWLISGGINGGLVFLPDPEHAWNGNTLSADEIHQEDDR